MPRQVTMTCDEFLDLAAGVALDAVEPDEVELVEQHARACPDCGLELQQFREVAAALGKRVAQVDPPAILREHVLDAVLNAERQRPRGVWPRALGRARLSAAWLVAAASFVISLGAIVWVA
ncbi:MAG: hypothetical protein LC797_24815, partial [Chloroflexi bacterium]|nr:hypothetical protein [Chloroflexota bacterium]